MLVLVSSAHGNIIEGLSLRKACSKVGSRSFHQRKSSKGTSNVSCLKTAVNRKTRGKKGSRLLFDGK